MPTQTNPESPEAQHGAAEGQIKSPDLDMLAAQEQYQKYASAAVTAAELFTSDGDRYNEFRTIMEGYLANSAWRIGGTFYILSEISSIVQSTSGTFTDMLSAIVLSEDSSRMYIATSGLTL